ncbi:transglutaminase-like domain-containing protein [Actinophytocola sp.]|uniref:transglutaminase-like domain-containing protein n=1 Tax=Actinophytocola sp. TaxID=1872138 RepID=UPI003D6ABA67
MTITVAQLRATEFLDHDSAEVQRFVHRWLPADASDPISRALALYEAVRDRVNYEVFGADLSREGLRASQVIARRSGMCLHKSVLYAAALRAAGVPSRLLLTDVRNHLASPRLRELVGGEVFTFHGLTVVHNGQRWVRATPVFNKTLCRLYGIAPLDFDGLRDSLHHPFDLKGRKHMEFLREHGEFDDFPYDLVLTGLRSAHPAMFASPTRFVAGSLVADADRNQPRQGDAA